MCKIGRIPVHNVSTLCPVSRPGQGLSAVSDGTQNLLELAGALSHPRSELRNSQLAQNRTEQLAQKCGLRIIRLEV